MSKKSNVPKRTEPSTAKTAIATKAIPERKPLHQAFVPRTEIWFGGLETTAFKQYFWILAGIFLCVMLTMSLKVGVNGDDSFQVDYSNKLLAYYDSGGKDTTALNIPKGNMHLYGGFFDVVAGVTNRTLGFTELQPAYHNTRHVLIALFGWGAMVLTALFVALLAGWQGAIWAFLLMFFSPRFLGDSLMNPKDIPYAFGNILALYGMLRLFKTLPQIDKWALAWIVLGMGIAEATRAGGILLFVYFGLFAGLHFVFNYGWGGVTSATKMVGRYAIIVLGCIAAAHLFAIAFWPYAWVSPIANPLTALSAFSQLGIKIRLLFNGDNVMSDKTSWDYALQWIFRTIPLGTLLGFLAGLGLIVPLWKRFPSIGVFMALFSVVFPLAYIIYKDSVLHDGWRHLYFVYPGMVIVASLALVWLMDRFQGAAWPKYAVYGVLAVCLLEPAVFIARNAAFPYVYFNPLNGGMKGAFGKFETDYWGISLRQAVEWLEEDGKISPQMTDTVTIATNYLWNLERYVTDRYKGKVKVSYLKYARRYDYAWDYAIYPSRFVGAAQLQSGNWPAKSSTIHTINANNTPICAIYADKTGFGFAAEAALKRSEAAAADSLYKLELKAHPDNEIAMLALANLAFSRQDLKTMLGYANQALQINPEDGQALNFVGIDQLQRNDMNAAMETFRRNIELNDDNFMAYYWTAMAQRSKGDLSKAAENLTKAVEIAPNFKQGYQLLAETYTQMGDNNMAARVMQVMQQMGGGAPR